MLKDADENVVCLPSRSSNLNSCAEGWIHCRWVERFSRVSPLGERHLQKLKIYCVVLYRTILVYLSLGNRLTRPHAAIAVDGRIRRLEQIGGVLTYYGRTAG